MHVTFFAAEKDREETLAEAFIAGVRCCGDTGQIVRPASYPAPSAETDVAVMVGVKGYSRTLLDSHLSAGKHTVYLDKGYLGARNKYFRASVDSFQPLAYFQRRPRPGDRLRELKITIQPMRTAGSHVVIAGGSLKYARWHGLHPGKNTDPMTEWAVQAVKRLRKHTSRPLLYRPKPSWKDAQRIEHVRYSRPPESIAQALMQAWALVTFGSNAAVDALIAGIPVIVTGDGIAQPLAKMSESSIEDLYIPTDAERAQWLADVAYCQFSQPEMASGLAWSILREQL